MPLEIPIDSLIAGIQSQGQGQGNSPYIINPGTGALVANPGYLNPLQGQQLSTIAQGATPEAIATGAYQTGANEASRLTASSLVAQNTPYGATDASNLYDPTTRTNVPVGTTPLSLKGHTILNPGSAADLQSIDAVQGLLNQVKQASSVVNTYNGQIGQRSIPQALKGIKLQASGDINADFLTRQVKGLLGSVASTAGGANRFNENEINSIQQLIPTVFDTKDTANAKIQHLQDLLNVKQSSILGTSNTP